MLQTSLNIWRALICSILILGSISFSGKLSAKQIEVCSTCTHSSISGALEHAGNGDVIEVHKGHYKEGNIQVDKAVTLRGIDFPIIDGENNSEIITVLSDDVVIEGIQLQNVGTSYTEDRAAIRIKKSDDFLIRNNRIINAFFGIYLEHSNRGIIVNNEIIGEAEEETSSGNAIHLWYCKNIEIRSNKVKHHRDGIYLEFVDKSSISENISEHNLRYGLHFMFSDENEFSQNTFQFNGAGVAVMFSRNIDMWENHFQNNWGKASYGLLLKEIYDTKITNNHFVENTTGIYVESSTRIEYVNNELRQNGWAMKISGGCLDNVISGNNFIGNTFDLSVSNNINDNKFDGNYWSEYNGYDLDNDGIGDVPYRPVKLFNFIVNQTPEALVLLRSLFVDLINFSEKVSPVFTPKNVLDNRPLMRRIN